MRILVVLHQLQPDRSDRERHRAVPAHRTRRVQRDQLHRHTAGRMSAIRRQARVRTRPLDRFLFAPSLLLHLRTLVLLNSYSCAVGFGGSSAFAAAAPPPFQPPPPPPKLASAAAYNCKSGTKLLLLKGELQNIQVGHLSIRVRSSVLSTSAPIWEREVSVNCAHAGGRVGHVCVAGSRPEQSALEPRVGERCRRGHPERGAVAEEAARSVRVGAHVRRRPRGSQDALLCGAARLEPGQRAGPPQRAL